MSEEQDKKDYQDHLDYQEYLATLKKQAGGKLIEEMHPEFATADRLLVKNIGNQSMEASPDTMAWLQERYPNLEIIKRGNRVFARSKGETDWRALDPDTGFFSKDFLRDSGDVAGAVTQGLAEGAAAAYAGLATAGAAAIPAGMGVGALSESIRQYLGRLAGLQKSYSPGEIGMNSLANGILPAGGLIYKGVRPAIPVAANILSGVPVKAVQVAMNRMDELDNLEKAPLFDAVENTKQKFFTPIWDAIGNKGREIDKTYKATPGTMSLNIRPILDVLGEQAGLAERTGIKRFSDNADEINQYIMDTLLRNEGVRRSLKGSVKGAEEIAESAASGTAKVKMTVAEKEAAKRLAAEQKAALEAAEREFLQGKPIEGLTAHDGWQLKKLLAHDAQRFRMPPTDGLKSSRDMSDKIRAIDEMIKQIDDQHKAMTNGKSEMLNKQYSDLAGFQTIASDYFSSPERAYSTFTNLESKNKTMLNGVIQKLKELTGADIEKDADLMFAQAHFGDKKPGGLNVLPISSGGTTSTTRTLLTTAGPIGAAGGYLAGQIDPMLAPVGTALGGLAFMGITGPRAMKQHIRRVVNAEKALQRPTMRFGAEATPRTAWHLLYTPEGNNQ